MDRPAAGLELDPCTDGDLLRRAYARITPLCLDVIHAADVCHLQKFTDFLSTGIFFRAAILSGHMLILLYDASILHLSGSLHKLWDSLRIRHLQIPVIFRLMYTCGLRPHEARLIQKEHLNLSESTIFIPESKGHKDRIVAMSPEMTKICSKYYPYAVREFPNSPYLFPCQRFKGAAYSSGWLTEAFHLCWNTAGLGEVAGNAPRPYDFRHTFATYRLYRWMKEKRELGALLPYLSVYMGHAHFSDTAYYIHLIPDFFSELSGIDLDAYGSLLPEVPYEY